MAFNVFDDDKNKIPLTELRKLLWTNPDPTESFSNQWIGLGVDISEFQCFEIVTLQGQVCRINGAEIGSGRSQVAIQQIRISGSYVHVLTRDVTLDFEDNGININSCYYFNAATPSTAPVIDNLELMPIEVYGIRYE